MPSDQQKEGERRMKDRWWEKSESAEEPARRLACRELLQLWAGESWVMRELLGHREVFLTNKQNLLRIIMIMMIIKCGLPVLRCGTDVFWL